jgi:hypothetical protein
MEKRILKFNTFVTEEYRKNSDKYSGLIHDMMLFLRNYDNIDDSLTIPIDDFLDNVNSTIEELEEFQEESGLVSFNIKIEGDNIHFYNLDKSSKQRHVWEQIQEKLLPKELRDSNLLFHATSYECFYNILKQNKLYGSNCYDSGVATSRNKSYLHNFSEYSGELEPGTADCQLILDKDKLKTQYKIKAFDWEEYKREPDKKFHQSEDKIITHMISPIDKYIIGIQFNNDLDYNLLKFKSSEFWNKVIDNNWIIFDKDWNILS